MGIPYARFLQAVRVAADARQEASREAMTVAAFVGWQTAGAFGGSKVGPFQKYLKSLGLEPKVRQASSGESKEVTIARVQQVVEGARAAFRRG